jgi:alanine racemase
MISIPRAVVYVNLAALESNYKAITATVSPGVKVLCVVKSDAYGHGAVEVARRLESAGVDWLGVATVDEGMELRQSGITSPVLVLSGILPWDDVEPVFLNGLTPVVSDFAGLDRIIENPVGEGPLNIHIKVDTGMGRLGFDADEIPLLFDRLKKESNIFVEGLMSHFSLSDSVDQYGLKQVEVFREVLNSFIDHGFGPRIAHMDNSGGLLNYPGAHFDMIRAGITLYGSYPALPLRDKLPLRQVMKVVSKIARLREFPPGRSLSYGRTFTTEKALTRIAYVPLGYGDGYPRNLSGKGVVLIRDQRCPIVGRVCMDWLLVDVTSLEGVEVEDEVVLLGHGEEASVTADELADLSGTIPYEILCRVSKRLLRVYV